MLKHPLLWSLSLTCTHTHSHKQSCERNLHLLLYLFTDGRAGDVVLGSYSLDRELCGCCCISWFNRTPFVRCLEWRQEISNEIWGGIWICKEANKHSPFCSYPWWSSKVTSRLLQGIFAVAIFVNHCIDSRCILRSPTHASCQFPASLVGYGIFVSAVRNRIQSEITYS